MFSTLLEQWKANQEQKRAIAGERWEQEKRWKEEEREETREREAAAREKKAAEDLAAQEEKAAEEERRQKLYNTLYIAHHEVLKRAATVSYVRLTCHEDTWTFIARRAFGTWSPEWLTSVPSNPPQPGAPGPKISFTKNPNLTPGRITKQDNGMQTVEVSGDNLVTILEHCFETMYQASWNPIMRLMDKDPNRSACGPLYRRISDWLEGMESGSVSQPGHTLMLDERIEDAD